MTMCKAVIFCEQEEDFRRMVALEPFFVRKGCLVQKKSVCLGELNILMEFKFGMTFLQTRSYAALRAADLDWIVGPGYSLGRVHSGEKP